MKDKELSKHVKAVNKYLHDEDVGLDGGFNIIGHVLMNGFTSMSGSKEERLKFVDVYFEGLKEAFKEELEKEEEEEKDVEEALKEVLKFFKKIAGE